MLVLSRKVGEQILIGKDIVITVVEIDRNKIRLGFRAPPTVPIYRRELLTNDTPNPKPAGDGFADGIPT